MGYIWNTEIIKKKVNKKMMQKNAKKLRIMNFRNVFPLPCP
jgi:hypothetical protein